MKIEFTKIKVNDLVDKYIDNDEEGVFGYNKKLNIRPKYQREFVYDMDQQRAVIYTILQNFPLNVMYWVKNQDDTFELLDGQQRTISICKFVNGDFSIKNNGIETFFQNLTVNEKQIILNYELIVYVCEGNDKEKLNWFRTINISGEKLTDQELLNINYTGSWLTSAKQKFSKTNCPACNTAKDFIKGSPIRQDVLETVLAWISGSKANIDQYMAKHQNDENANELWLYYMSVINWIMTIFPHYRKEMKGLDWGMLYNKYHDNAYDGMALEAEINKLMSDDEVTKKSGIYEYLLSNKTNKRVLSLRAFTDSQKRTLYERQKGICPICGEHFELKKHGC